MMFSPNDSPLAGRVGVHLTGTKIGERLRREADTSVSIRVLPADQTGDAFEVQARGELQLGLLIGDILKKENLCNFTEGTSSLNLVAIHPSCCVH